jgi:hypothetical protein
MAPFRLFFSIATFASGLCLLMRRMPLPLKAEKGFGEFAYPRA